MQLNHLSLTHFRNFTRLDLAFTEGVTILVGANAQGKTSLLDAIHYLTSAQSPHTSNDRHLIHFDALQDSPPFARIVAEIQRNSLGTQDVAATAQKPNPLRIEIRLILNDVGQAKSQRLRREVLINGVKRRVRQLAGVFNAVMFLPKDMRIVEGSPTERRSFLDNALYQSDPIYAHALSEYAAVLSQRNALLKQMQERKSGKDEIAYWDEKLCEYAATLITTRLRALQEINDRARPIHNDISRGKETLRLEYLPSFLPATRSELDKEDTQSSDGTKAQIDSEAIQSTMMTALQRKRAEEIARGTTTIGPHRDDFRFLANDIDLRFYGSRGQNRTAMLATQLAEVDWLRYKTGEYPVLLLDEVMAELDPMRREDLLERLRTAHQAILTTADLDMFTEEFRSHATLRQIANGVVSPWKDA